MSDYVFSMSLKVPIIDEENETSEDHEITLDEPTKIYQKNKFMYDLLKECLYDDAFKEPLNTKIWAKVLSHETSQSLKLNSNRKTFQLFGLEAEKDADLSYDEQCVLREQFLKKLSSIQKENSSTSSNNQLDDELHNAIDGDETLITTRSKLTEQIELYSENILEFYELLNEAQKIHSTKILKMCEDKFDETKIKNKFMEYKVHCLNQRVKLNTINERDVSKNAYKTLLDDITKQKFDLEMDIERLTKLKEMYKSAECKEYDEILNSYLLYMRSIDGSKKNLK